MGRFSVVIRRSDDHYCIKVESGYRTREDAERIAEARKRAIDEKGWAMYVTIDEAHIVGEANEENV